MQMLLFHREVLKEDESGSLKATVEDILFQSKRRRCVAAETPETPHPQFIVVSLCFSLPPGSWRVMDRSGSAW